MKLAQAVKPKPRVATGGVTAPRKPIAVAGSNAVPGAKGGGGSARNTNYGKQLAAANPPPASGAPWDSAYESSAAAARAKYQNALVSLGYNKTALQQDYGLDQGFNDYKTNPYSRAAALENAFQRANRSSQTSLGSSGQLYSGALQNQLGYNRSNRDQGDHELRSSYLQALQDIRDKELAAQNEMQTEMSEAAWRRAENAMEAPLEPSAAPAAAGGAPKGSFAKTKKGVKYGVHGGGKAPKGKKR